MFRCVVRGSLPLLMLWVFAAAAHAAAVRVVELPKAPATMPGQARTLAGGRVENTSAWLGKQGASPLWFALALTRDWQQQSPPLLVIEGNVLDRITVYLPPDYRPRTDTIFNPSLDPRFSHHAVVYELPPGLRAGTPVYLAFGVPRQRPPVRVRIVDAASYRAADLQYVRASTLFSAIQGSMVLVILCFWIVLRDRALLYFIVYAGTLMLFGMAGTGELYALPATRFLGQFGNAASLSMAALAAAFLIWFTLDFAALRQFVPRLARWLWLLSWPYLVLALVMWLPWLDPNRWPARLMNGLLIVSSLSLLLSSWLAWRRGSRQAGFFLLAWVPLLLLTALRTVLVLSKSPQPTWMEFGFPGSMAWAAVIITVGLADRSLQVRRERDKAIHIAQFDPLTGVYNRRVIIERLQDAWRTTAGQATPLAVLFLDLDHFKQINDSRGHAAGDACLTAVTEAVRAELGPADRAGRYGGEEFLVVLRGDSARMALRLAERIAARVAALRVPVGAHLLALTVSIGVAVRDPDTTSPEALVEQADAAQYQAKAAGRNRVVVFRVDDALETVGP